MFRQSQYITFYVTLYLNSKFKLINNQSSFLCEVMNNQRLSPYVITSREFPNKKLNVEWRHKTPPPPIAIPQ